MIMLNPKTKQDSLLEQIIPRPPKKTPESKRNEMFPLKRNDKDTIYINESSNI